MEIRSNREMQALRAGGYPNRSPGSLECCYRNDHAVVESITLRCSNLAPLDQTLHGF
jgi:hypothetical protein